VKVTRDFQAGSENVSGSTFSERKIMSTKTSFKRVALVAAAALTLGGLSAVSANATPQADTLTVSATTATAIPGAAAAVTVTQTYLSTGAGDAVTATASLVSMPAGNTSLPSFVSVTTNDAGLPQKAVSASGLIATTDNVVSGVFVKANYTLSLTTQTVGTYVVKVTPQAGSAATAATVTFTIADTASSANVKGSRVYMRSGAADHPDPYVMTAPSLLSAGGYTTKASVGGTTSAQLLPLLGAQIAAQDLNSSNLTTYAYAGGVATTSNVVANFGVILSNNDTITASTLIGATQCPGAPSATCATAYGPSSAYYFNAAGHPVTMKVSGPGWVRYANIIKGKTYTEVSTDGDVNYLQKTFELVSDGTTGVSTVTFTADGVTLASFTVNFYGTATTITPTVAKPLIVAGSNTAAITAIVSDANGVPVPNKAVYAVSDTAAAVSNSYTSCGTSDATGKVSCDLTGVAAGTAKITLTTNTSSTDTTGISASAVSVRVGTATVASYVISTDKDSYASGEVATVSIKMLDASGLAVADSVAIGGALSSTQALTTNGFSALATPTAGTGNGTYSFKVNMPVTSGDVKLTFTPSGDYAALAAASVTVAVTNSATDAAQAAIDAAQEATDAANAAYDAANNAMDSADAATAAAQDASDNASAALAAVTDLAATVAKLVASVNAIASALAKLQAVQAKIQKKLKA